MVEDWLRLSSASAFLAIESGAVIWLRGLALLAGGSSARREALKMITEKWSANVELATRFAAGGPLPPARMAETAIAVYTPKVRANRKRLARR